MQQKGNKMSSAPYQCPLCHQPLQPESSRWTCGQHHFDRAKEGYVNLLPVQFKRSKQPGDNAEMMKARRAFLDAGHYSPLRHHLCEALMRRLSGQVESVLDIGCGEGYYTDALSSCLADIGVQVFGLDVSKVAIQRAARRYRQVNFCVASSQRLPFNADSLDAALKIYAPCNDKELGRVVKSGGLVMTVSPGPRHLYQLKERIYRDVKLHLTKEEMLEGFELEDTTTLRYTLSLTGEEAAALLQMTPFAWKATSEVMTSLTTESLFECETDFLIRTHRKS
ncbi:MULTISPECIES: 23S rRNA (guanine(745)-N(1))-methyltransferase [Lonsdalea]|nr:MULTISPECIES: 23S rRNA (guanine(745)-N(1))-methyltransferase [Lonsdalea]